jgi:hypothetical protein
MRSVETLVLKTVPYTVYLRPVTKTAIEKLMKTANSRLERDKVSLSWRAVTLGPPPHVDGGGED